MSAGRGTRPPSGPRDRALSRCPRARDRGSATVELALGVVVLLLVLAAASSVLVVGAAQLRCVDASREAARAVARGAAPAQAVAAGRAVAPRGASVQVAVAGGQGRATVRARVALLGPLVPAAVDVTGRAVSHVEPGVG